MCYSKFDRQFLQPIGGVDKYSLLKKIDPYPEQYEEYEEPVIINHSSYYDMDNLISLMKKNRKQFSIFSTNIECINTKIDELKIFVNMLKNSEVEFSAICIQEAWLAKGADVSRFEIDGYKLIPQGYSKLASYKGGLLVYLNDKHEYSTKLTLDKYLNWEGQFIQVKKGAYLAKPVLIGNIYRRPLELNKDYQEFISEFTPILRKVHSANSDVALCGDYNVDLLKINERSVISDTFDMFSEYSYFPKMTLPTRLSRKNATLIDNIYCKLTENTIDTISGITSRKISDHQGCFTFIDNAISAEPNSKYFTFTKENDQSYENLKEALGEIFDSNPFDQNVNLDPNINYNRLHGLIQNAKDEFMPTIKVKFDKYKHKRNKWITDEIINQILERDNLYKLHRMTHPNSHEYTTQANNLKQLNNNLRKNIRNAKKSYYANLFDTLKSDMKGTWKTIKEILNKSKNKNTFPSFFRDENNKIITDKVEIANKFNTFFSTVGKKLAQNITVQDNKSFKDFLNRIHHDQFYFENINEILIGKIISELAPKASCGFDGFSSKLIKKLQHVLVKPITLIVNQMINTGIFPDKLKIAKINPIYKKDDETFFTNYRPISLLPAISKIFEKVIFIQIYDFFQKKKLLYISQYGFRTGHSTESAALELVDKIITKMDKKDTPIGIFIDLSKAFDTIDHEILLKKLNYYGFSTPAISLMKSYLNDRMQYVQMNDVSSDFCEVNTGVPQGSILGPLLFIIYMNDIIESSKLFDFILYADDTSLTTSVELVFRQNPDGIQNCINAELENINIWLKLNKLSLNISKTKYMIFHSINKKLPLLTLEIEGTPIERVTEFNFLGFTLDEHMKWNKHVDKVSNKVSRNIGILNSMKHFLPLPTKKLIYNSLIASHINYGILVWGYTLGRLEKLQKKAVRIITLSKYNAHSEPILKKLKLLKLRDILDLQTLKFYFKFKHDLLPVYLLKLPFQHNYEIHHHNTRSRSDIHWPTPAHVFATKSLRYNLPIVVNNTTNDIIEKIRTHSLDGFAGYIKEKYITSYEENCNLTRCYICNR